MNFTENTLTVEKGGKCFFQGNPAHCASTNINKSTNFALQFRSCRNISLICQHFLHYEIISFWHYFCYFLPVKFSEKRMVSFFITAWFHMITPIRWWVPSISNASTSFFIHSRVLFQLPIILPDESTTRAISESLLHSIVLSSFPTYRIKNRKLKTF